MKIKFWMLKFVEWRGQSWDRRWQVRSICWNASMFSFVADAQLIVAIAKYHTVVEGLFHLSK